MCEPYAGAVPWGCHPPWHTPPWMFPASRGALRVRDVLRSGHLFGVAMVTPAVAVAEGTSGSRSSGLDAGLRRQPLHVLARAVADLSHPSAHAVRDADRDVRRRQRGGEDR